MTQLILASGSPRRRAFLAALGLDYLVQAADVDESAQPGEPPEELVRRLSRAKARAVAGQHPGLPVLAADTVVVLDGRILGKPAGPEEAVAMLQSLRGRVHQVQTAVSLAHDGACAARVCCSQVWMRDYADAEIRAYVATGDPLDKAGAYAIQHPMFSPVARWEGCYAGIMGLPLGMVAGLLAGVGISLSGEKVMATCERASGSGRCCLHGLPSRC